jgi:hypothetical protein
MRRALRALLFLFGVFVLASAIIIATHRHNSTPGGAAPPGKGATAGATGKAVTGTTLVKSLLPNRKTTTTSEGVEPPLTNKPLEAALGPGASYVLFNVHESGDDTIGRFAVATNWDVNWSYDCSENERGANFNYTVDNAERGGSDAKNVGPSQHESSGTGVERYHDAGTFYMTVASKCSWTVKVTEFGP